MADPTTPSTDPTAVTAATNDQAEALSRLTEAYRTQTQAYSDMGSMADVAKNSMDVIDKAATEAGVSLGNLTALTEEQTEKFAIITSAVVRAREAFSGFAGVDYSGLSTLTDQMNVIKEAFATGGMAAAKAVEAVKTLTQQALDLGATQSQVTKAMSLGTGAVIDLATNMAKHADNMARGQTASVQMAARTGELGDVLEKTGDHLQDMNVYLEKQQEMMKLSRDTTGLTATQTEKWYNQLGLIHGALKEDVALGSKSGATTSMLTATIEAATGAGMSQTETMENLNAAFKDYNLVGEKALLFSIRMSDVSTKLGAPIDDVTRALRGSADAFKMFATGQDNASKSAESLAKTLNVYGKALESTGLSATQAVEMAGNLANQTAKLTTGQLAFISQRTGGAGGLQGAAQETLKLQTDPGAVVEDAMKTLQQQFGKIVTVQEAATSQSAASINIKQTTMLQSLLGPLAKDQASANRLLEAMKNRAEGNPKAIAAALSEHPIQDAAQKGADMQAKTYTVTTKIMDLVEQIRDIGDRGGSAVVGKFTAAGTPTAQGKPETLREQVAALFESQLKKSLFEGREASRAKGGIQVQDTAQQLKTGLGATGGVDAAADIHGAMASIKDLTIFGKSAFKEIVGHFASGDKEGEKQDQAMLKEFVEGRKQMVKQLEGNPKEQEKARVELKAAQALLDGFSVTKSAGQQVKNFVPFSHAPSSPSGQRVGTAAQHAVAFSGGAAAGAAHAAGTGAAPANVPGANPNTLHIVGKFSMDCPFCGKAHDVSPHFKTFAGPSGQSQQ
jgi:hypothetical protein